MRLLIDTQLLIWTGQGNRRLTRQSTALLADVNNRLVFSTISVAEVAIKRALNRADFMVDPGDFRSTLLANGFEELPLTGDHACRLSTLPPIHKDPFDRLLVAQAASERIALVTSDSVLARYGNRVIVV